MSWAFTQKEILIIERGDHKMLQRFLLWTAVVALLAGWAGILLVDDTVGGIVTDSNALSSVARRA